MSDYRLRISGNHYNDLRKHLFPGDGLEAVAFILCGRRETEDSCIFVGHRIVPVPYEACTREVDRVTWKSGTLASILDEARQRNMSIVKVHSHTAFFERFSTTDDESDREVFRAIEAWTDGPEPHGSAVMLPDGRLFGRASDGTVLSEVAVVGTELSYWHYGPQENAHDDPAFEANAQLFGAGTTTRLRKLRIAVIGCSGTGSVLIELLARLGVGTLLLVDPDRIEARNLNRIVNSKKSDIGKYKVDAIKAAIESHGLGTKIETINKNLFEHGVVGKVAEADIVFGCMDTAEGRHLLNRLATFYVMPYFDLGVHLRSDGEGGISEASGVVHFVEPGQSSLVSRKAYSLKRVEAEGLRRTNPDEYERQKEVNYIEGIDEQSPAVISVNALIVSLAVNEFLARLHPYRSCANEDSTITRFNLMETEIFTESESEACRALVPHVGRGDVNPLLDMPALSVNES